jgi:hypothetical protein
VLLFGLIPVAYANADPVTIDTSAVATPPTVLEKIVVSGEQPGPGLWKVTRGEHVLWIVGTQTPVPKNMTWRAKGVAALVADAQEILSEPGASVTAKKIGYFTTLTLLPSIMDARKNPGGATLKEVVPAELYRRWEVLRQKYVGEYNVNDEENDLDRWRPIFVALRLYSRAIDKSGMTSNNPVWPAIVAAAAKHRVKITDVKFEPEIIAPRAAIREFSASRLADIECFEKTIERIETDLVAMRARANAWAVGDVAALRKLPAIDQRAACEAALRAAPFMKMFGANDLLLQMEATWLNAVDAALTKNKLTLAVLPIAQLVTPKGYVAKLRLKGYRVDEPDATVD